MSKVKKHAKTRIKPYDELSLATIHRRGNNTLTKYGGADKSVLTEITMGLDGLVCEDGSDMRDVLIAMVRVRHAEGRPIKLRRI